MNQKISLAEKEQCTACGACKCVCPTNSIEMHLDEMGCEYPHINESSCIGCGLCIKVCPANKEYVGDSSPYAVYAAWNKNDEDRKLAASGGIATAIYRYALSNGIKIFGVKYTPHQKACYIEIKSENDIKVCRNSKYVFSDITPVLPKIKQYLSKGKKVIVIALPCQAAAVLGYLGGRISNLLLIDIACHGVCPVIYLNQHICEVEQKKKAKASKVYFRDPNFGTGNFIFSIYNDEEIIYNCGVYKNDVYQIGYHKALTYRENCYSCKYAQPNRIGDITISDFSGLGRIVPFVQERNSVSCVMISSDAGNALFEDMIKRGMIEAERRPCEEAFEYEKMFRSPSIPHAAINIFKREYIRSQNFEKAAYAALKKDIRTNMIRSCLHTEDIKRLISKYCPKGIKKIVKRMVKR